jgi:hypothetical protein
MTRFAQLAVAALFAFSPLAATAQSCGVVQLDAGFSSGDLSGTAPADGVACFDLRFPRGQNLSIELVSGRNVTVSVPGHYDARSDRMFLGDLPGQLDVRVFQLDRAATPQPFVLRIRFEEPGNG